MFGKFWALVENYGRVQGELAGSQAECSRLKASCDFLAAQVTKLEAERAVMLDRLIGLQLPVFQVERQSDPVTTGSKLQPDLTPEALAKLPARFAPPPEGVAGQIYRPPMAKDIQEADVQAAMALFEDLGDERAAKLGISHTDDGQVVYS
jgi:hypothetical protein